MKHRPERSHSSTAKTAADKQPFTHPDDPRNTTWHGYWNLDGSWVETGNAEDYLDAPSGTITRFVRQLVFKRRTSAFAPREAAMLAEAHRFQDAFPCRSVWVDAPTVDTTGEPLTLDEQWIGCPANTSAEQAVKSAGMGQLTKHPDRGGPPLPEAVREFMARWREWAFLEGR